MKLGIFDSGLGGLLIAKAVREHLPDPHILYFGDTLHLPYGNRSEDAIYMYTKKAIDYMFSQGCALIVIACNTASAAALRRLQQGYIASAYPGRNVIGIVVPTLEAALERGYKNLGVIGTNYIIRSDIFRTELQKINQGIQIRQKATPLLVPLIENDGMKWAEDVLRHYMDENFVHGLDCILLGCTHYPFLRSVIQKILDNKIEILSQDDILPEKLKDYLSRHPEYNSKIALTQQTEFYVSDLTENYQKAANAIYGCNINVQKADITV